MTDKDFEGDEVRPGPTRPEAPRDASASRGEGVGNAEGSEAHASGSDAQDDLTVEDILGTEQSADAIAEDAVEDAKLADLESTLLNDLKRLQAEYANYRRRTEEQRQLDVERAKGEAAKGMLPVLDDLDRAAKHGDLEEGSAFALIAEKIRAVAERLGVVSFGEAGAVFDPQHHEAVFQQPVPGATETTVLEVVEVGYRLGDVELRPAKVVVAVPAD